MVTSIISLSFTQTIPAEFILSEFIIYTHDSQPRIYIYSFGCFFPVISCLPLKRHPFRSQSLVHSPVVLSVKRSRWTITRCEAIVQEHSNQGASLGSSFFTAAVLPVLEPSIGPNFPPSIIEVVNVDSFTATRDIIREIIVAQ